MTSEELLKGCRNNDQEAWTYAYNYLIRFIQKKYPSHPRIKDLAHDTLLYFIEKGVHEVKNPGAFMKLLRLKAAGLFIDGWRLEFGRLPEPLEIQDNEGDTRPNPSIPHSCFDPEKALLFKETVSLLRKALLTMGQKCREVLRRYFSARLREMKVKDLAKDMGVEYSALRTEIHRCHDKLRQNDAYREMLEGWER